MSWGRLDGQDEVVRQREEWMRRQIAEKMRIESFIEKFEELGNVAVGVGTVLVLLFMLAELSLSIQEAVPEWLVQVVRWLDWTNWIPGLKDFLASVGDVVLIGALAFVLGYMFIAWLVVLIGGAFGLVFVRDEEK